MMTREPQPGDQIEYNPLALKGQEEWKPVGTVVAVHESLCYTRDESLPWSAHEKLFGKGPIPEGCERANRVFIWYFRNDGLNVLHRIVEPTHA